MPETAAFPLIVLRRLCAKYKKTKQLRLFRYTMEPPAEERLNSADMKKMAAEEAVKRYVKDGMAIGLGTGTTANFAILKIGELAAEGLDVTCVATSVQSERLARSCGIEVYDLDQVGKLDITIDGTDEADRDMQLIKGLGGALLREKIVAAATVKEIIVAGESKVVDKLGTTVPLPVEVIPFGHAHTAKALARLGCTPVLRMAEESIPFVTDSGNYIYDCRFPDGIDMLYRTESAVNNIPGVVENGLFLNTAYEVLVCDRFYNITSMSRKAAERRGNEIRVV